MVYITVKQSPIYKEMSLEDFLFSENPVGGLVTYNTANTKTYAIKDSLPSDKLASKFQVEAGRLYYVLKHFNQQTESLRRIPRKELYDEFFIPKKSGGLRKINAPKAELMTALRNLKTIFEREFKALYHTSAFAYIKHRSTLDAIKKHQSNESKWFAKFDLSDFFGSTTLEYMMKMFMMIYPFSLLADVEGGKEELEKALELATLDGGLPQGTPISPLITNIIMIPVDFKLSNGLRDYNRQHFIYTRYADDFLISSRYDFDYKTVQKYITDVLNSFGAPFKIKEEKTRYGSSAGSNWNLGVMLNKDNNITIGHKKKRQFQAMLSSFVLDTMNGNRWSLEDVQRLEGLRNYYKMVEGEVIDRIVAHIAEKYQVNIVGMIKEQLKG